MGMFWANISENQDANLILMDNMNQWLDYGLEIVDEPFVRKLTRFLDFGMYGLDKECLHAHNGYTNNTKPAYCLGVDIPDPSTPIYPF